MAEQRNAYRGKRPWLRLGFKATDGEVHHLHLIADTGSAAGVLLRTDWFMAVRHKEAITRNTNLGELISGWVRLYNPEIGLVEFVRGFASDKAAEIAANSDPEFVGLVGLPVLRLMEYGGNYDTFWLRTP
jgi:hypothetical protein